MRTSFGSVSIMMCAFFPRVFCITSPPLLPSRMRDVARAVVVLDGMTKPARRVQDGARPRLVPEQCEGAVDVEGDDYVEAQRLLLGIGVVERM